LLYSITATDLWMARGMYASLPAQALVAGALLAAIDVRWLRAAPIAAVLLTLVLGSARALSASYVRPPFRAAATYLDRVAPPSAPIIMYPSFLDPAIPAQLQRPHELRSSAPSAWAGVAPGGMVFVVLDDMTARALHIGTPHPSGFELVARRHYTGLLRFSVLSYERVPPSDIPSRSRTA